MIENNVHQDLEDVTILKEVPSKAFIKEQIASKKIELAKRREILALDVAEQSCAANDEDKEYAKDLEVLKQLRVEEDEIALKELKIRKESIKKQIEFAENKIVSGPSKDIEAKNLTRQDFDAYRRSHPGPKSRAAFRVWKENGADRPGFTPYPRRVRGRDRGGSTVVNNFSYTF
ncbi:uncharacterized protein LOC136087357 isoform X2 [Hydra vulgaris]|uniref:Uncharacterized protein LOC136087357 isoform X2 n=1 Tax=Hydra vulgaris TaxID=6087 RepID=A0ABM4CVK7_HYDVU